MAGWLLPSALLLLSLLCAPTFCNFVGDWLVYLLLWRERFASEPRRTGGLQVILCGFSRTGTRSLTAALQVLGFRCLHNMHLFYPPTAKRFLKAYRHGNPQDWEKVLEGFTAIADYLAAMSYKQLERMYPNAKIILNIRDANKWYDSYSNTILRMRRGEQHWVFKILTMCTAECGREFFCQEFGDEKPENRDVCVTAFLQHIEDVKNYVPPEKLLIYDVEKDEGWTPLCQFLNVPEPEEPFPKVNVRSDFNGRMERIGNVYMTVLGVYVALVACMFVYII